MRIRSEVSRKGCCRWVMHLDSSWVTRTAKRRHGERSSESLNHPVSESRAASLNYLPNFFIDSSVHHGNIALDCLKLLKKLKPNPCDLPNFVMNRDVDNLPGLLEDKVGGATRYACGHWATHLGSSPTANEYAIQLISSTIEFFKSNTLPWLEVMSLENKLESVIHSIYGLLDWLGKVCEHKL